MTRERSTFQRAMAAAGTEDGPVDRDGDTAPDGGVSLPPSALEASPCLVVVYSRDLRELCRRYTLESAGGPYRMGRADGCQVLLDNPQVSRHHGRIEHRPDGWWVVDESSRNGVYLNDTRVPEGRLAPGDRLRVGQTVFKYLAGYDAEAEYLEAIRVAMRTDGLTQALTHAAFREALAAEHARSVRHHRPMAVVMIDLDHFKTINDTHGHLAGDQVLRQLASVIRGRVRQGEAFGRLGGEEFALVLPETTLAGARTLAADLQQRIAAHTFEHEGRPVAMTASFGVAVLTPDMTVPEALLERADRLLYAAKHAGRNQLVSDPD